MIMNFPHSENNISCCSFSIDESHHITITNDKFNMKQRYLEDQYSHEMESDISSINQLSTEDISFVSENQQSCSTNSLFKTLLFQDDNLQEWQEQLRNLSQEVQDVSLMTTEEKDMYINHFNKMTKCNIYKNFLRLFTRFMLASKTNISIECLDKNNQNISVIKNQFQRFVKNVSHPDNICRILKSDRFSKFFQYYLKEHFLENLLNGTFKKIKDHYVANIFFLICLEDSEQIKKIKFLEK